MKKDLKYWLDHTEEVLLVVTLIAMSILTLAQVVSRYLLNSSLTWTEEIAKYLFVWLSWIGVSLGARKNKHITIDFVVNFFSGKRAFMWLNILAELLTFSICLVILMEGVKLTSKMHLIKSVSPILRIPMGVCYLSVVVGAGAMMLRCLERIWGWVKRGRQGYYEDPVMVNDRPTMATDVAAADGKGE